MTYGNAIRIAAAAFVMLFLAGYAASRANAAAPGEEAEAFIHNLATSGVAMLEQKDISHADRDTEFRRLVRKGFALEAIGRFVVGRYWRQMSPDQQAEYQDLFAEWLLKSYANRLGGFEGQRLEIVNSLELQNRNQDIVVRTRVVQVNGQPPIAADWRIRKLDGEPKIIDVIVEGVSMAAAQKSEFETVIRKVGVEGLLDSLRSRLSTLVAETQ
jgi:phospholipid transport system substrate-binding protein